MDKFGEISNNMKSSFNIIDEKEIIIKSSKHQKVEKNKLFIEGIYLTKFKIYGISFFTLGFFILCVYLSIYHIQNNILNHIQNPAIKKSDGIYTNENILNNSQITTHVNNHEFTIMLKNHNQSQISLVKLGSYMQEMVDLGVTSILIFDSLVNGLPGNTIEDLYNLVDTAKENNIKVVICLDILFSWKINNALEYPKNYFLMQKGNKLLIKNKRIIINSTSSYVKLTIFKTIKIYTEANIKDYIIFNNPQKIYTYMDDKHKKLVVRDEIDIDLLLETVKFISSIFSFINLYYSYQYVYETIDIQRELTTFSGPVIILDLKMFQQIFLYSTLFFDVFGHDSKWERKLIYFDIPQNNIILHNTLFLGIYLFSPVEIISSYEESFLEDYNSLTNKQKMFKKKLLCILKMKTEDIYFSNETILLSVKIYFRQVLVALRGNDKNEKSKMIILLYNYGFFIRVPVSKILNIPKNMNLSIIYDNSPFNQHQIIPTDEWINMNKSQLIILRVL